MPEEGVEYRMCPACKASDAYHCHQQHVIYPVPEWHCNVCNYAGGAPAAEGSAPLEERTVEVEVGGPDAQDNHRVQYRGGRYGGAVRLASDHIRGLLGESEPGRYLLTVRRLPDPPRATLWLRPHLSEREASHIGVNAMCGRCGRCQTASNTRCANSACRAEFGAAQELPEVSDE